ncbi:two-component system chemotaxis family response regulator WspR [Novosphingobium sp. SG751A]|uniref:diguanylate cyclase domain-containing protein n=1 Tax=Novosphingobium sp. SG751A TaxID=2587000 RepID=UPI001552A619|nr:diguanylate cyclase [Novosphingobium sp. SG751A]NOW45747.1 two-component system chemotaxis family response regulator WspR [Novosphingobium sp. SG751A]
MNPQVSVDPDMGDPEEPIPNQSIMVLLVDDQIMVGEAVRRALLDEVGIEFHYCSNPLDALAIARTVQPTVILQDLVMPSVNGLDLVRQYRTDPHTRNIPIIVLSTKEEASVKSDAFRAGANDYLVKLPDRIELIARIRYHSAAYLSQIQRDEAYRALRKSQQELMQANFALQRLTNVDGLTGLSNRRYFDEYFETEWRQAARDRQPLSLLIIDIDHFKQFNDTYGHLAGDEVLRKVAQCVQAAFRRPKDLVVRLGGEEFVVVLPATPMSHLAMLGQRVVDAVEALDLAHSSSPVSDRVTISVGGAGCQPDREDRRLALMEAADKALYEAKRSGRNRAVIDRGL